MTAGQILDKYIKFFEDRGHKRIANSPLVPQNDPTTLFTSSGMQPLVPYLLGETHPQGTRLVNVQNSFRAQDIEEIGDNRHTTFFRMLGNWSLGDYFKKDQLPWFFDFLTKELKLNPERLYVTIFDGEENFKVKQKDIKQSLLPDVESYSIWAKLFDIETNEEEKNKKIKYYGPEKNWWSRSGPPDKMPIGEPGGPDSEVFYDFGEELKIHEDSDYKDTECHPNCDCGRFMEIGNSVFMQYKKINATTFEELPNKNVDFGGGLERLVAATENQPDVFQTSLFKPIISSIEKATNKIYDEFKQEMRIIADHFVASVFIINSDVIPSNKEQGYILRRLIRRALDNIFKLNGSDVPTVIETIIEQYSATDQDLSKKYERTINTILEEEVKYQKAWSGAISYLSKKYKRLHKLTNNNADKIKSGTKQGDELKSVVIISADDAFNIYTSHGLSPTQIKSLGYTFDDQSFAEKMKAHKDLSRKGAEQKFRGGLADHQEKTIMGHTATHLLHQALRDMFGKQLHQSGSNITAERLRFDFNFDRKLTDEEIKQLEDVINKKIAENLPVHFEMIPTKDAKQMGAIGLFEDTYQETSKIYFIGGDSKNPKEAYSIEFCGGPHVDFTGTLKSVKIIKQENLGNKMRRIYAKVAE